MLLAFFLASLYGTVNQPVVNMYSAPTSDSDVVSQVIYGVRAEYLESKGDWVKIRSGDAYNGWVEHSRMKAQTDYGNSGKTASVSSLFANVYRESSVTKHQPILMLPYESKLEVIAEPETNNRRWLQVRLVDDRSGWVQRGDLSFADDKLSVEQVVALSRRFLGLPYTWGGTSSFGYDCSGFTQMLCRRQGVNLPRDAGPQAEWEGVNPVERAKLAAGDLLFFGSSLKKITHTGFYIGDDQFIHATVNQQPVIQISRLADQPWTRLFVAARRPNK